MKPYTGSIQQEDATSQMRPYQGSIRQEASEQEEPKAAVKKPASGALRRVVGDPLVALARGAAKIPNVVSGLGDIVSGGRFGKFLEDEVGYDFEAADRTYNPLLSHETQAAQQKLSEAKGIVDTVSTAVRNPSTIVQAIGESIPSMFVGGAIGRGVVAGASKIPAFAGGAIGEGVTMAGQSADTIRRGNADRRLTAKQAALATGVGVGGGLISGFSGALAKKLGVGNIDEMMVTGKLTNDPLDLLATKKSTVAQVAKGFATEGLLEEAPQSAQETMLQNVAQDKDVMEGVGESVGMGLITGGVMGGAAGGAHNLKRNLGVALADRTARIIKDEKAKQDASAIVTEAKTEVDAAAAAQAQQAKQARDQELAGKLPEIKARVARGVDGQTASFTEDIETVSEVFETTSDPKAKLEAGTLLNNLEKSADEAATDEEKATVKNNVTDIGHLQNAIVSDPYDVEAEEALFAYVNDSDPITAKKASDAITKGNEQKEKLEAEAVKKQDEQEKKTRADQEALGQAHRDELRADNKATEAVKLSEEKISDFKQKIREAATTTQKNSLRIKMNTEEQNLKHLKAERDLEKGKTISAKEALRPERSVITDMMGGQQIYEAVVNHKSFHKIAATAKNYLDYAKQMIAAFGKRVEAHLKDLWAYAKTTLRSERGSISFEEQEQHAANLAEDHWTDESAPTEEEYNESMSFDNDLENESMSFDNDLNMKPELDESKNMLTNESVGDGRSAATLLAKRKEANKQRLIRKEKLAYLAPKTKEEIRENRASKSEEPNGIIKREELVQANSAKATGAHNQPEYTNDEAPLYEVEHDDDNASAYEKKNAGRNKQAQGAVADTISKEVGISSAPGEKLFGNRFSSVEKNKEGARKPGYEKGESAELKEAREAIKSTGALPETAYQKKQNKVIEKIIAQLRTNKTLADYTTEYTLTNGIQQQATKDENASFELPPGTSIPKVLADELDASEYTIDRSAETLRKHLSLVADTYDMDSMYRFLLGEYRNETGRNASSFASMEELPSAMLLALDVQEEAEVAAGNKAEAFINELRDRGLESDEIALELTTLNTNGKLRGSTLVPEALESLGLDKIVDKGMTQMTDFLDQYFAMVDRQNAMATKSIGHLVNRDGTITLPDGRSFNTKSTSSLSGFMNSKEGRKAIKAIEFSPSTNDMVEGNNTSANPEPPIAISKYREDDSYDDMAKEKNWSNEDLRNEARANQTEKPVNKEREAAEKHRLDKQYEGFQSAHKVNKAYPALVKALYSAVDKIIMSKDLSELTAKNIFAELENVLYKSKFGNFEMEQRQFEGLSAQEKIDLIEVFLGRQIHKVPGEEAEWHTRGEFDGEGLTEYTEMLKEKNQLGVALVDDYDTVSIDPIVYSQKGISSLPARNDYRGMIGGIGGENPSGYIGTASGPKLVRAHSFTGTKVDSHHDRSTLTALHDLALATIPEYKRTGEYANALMLARASFEYKMNLLQEREALKETLAAVKASVAIRREQLSKRQDLEPVTEQQHDSANKLTDDVVSLGYTIRYNELAFDKEIATIEKTITDFFKGSKGLEIKEMVEKEKAKLEKSIARYQQIVESDKAAYDRELAKSETSAETFATKERLDRSSRILADQKRRFASPYTIKAQAAIQALEYKITNQQLKARALLMKKSFVESSVMDKALFENVAKGYNQLLPEGGVQLTPAQAYNIFLQSGSDIGIFKARINLMSDQAYESAVSEAYTEARATSKTVHDAGQSDKSGIIRPIITARLTAKEKEMYEKVASGLDGVPRRMLYKLKALYAIESRITALEHVKPEKRMKFDVDMKLNPADKALVELRKEQRLADALQKENEFAVEEDFCKEKPAGKVTEAEQAIIDAYPGGELKAVTVKGDILRVFLEKVAKMFGADLVTVSGNYKFKGAYIPIGVDGRPKVVVNVTKGSLTRIFAHEMFHHVLNKISPTAYVAFKTAIRESVDDTKWREAVNRVGAAKYSHLTSTEFFDITTNAMNANPMSRLTSGGPLKQSGAVNKHQPKGYYEKKSDGNFNHNPLENKSQQLVSAEDDARRTVGQTAVTTFNFSEKDIDAIENELYAEVFTQAVHQRGFWDALSESLEGRSLAARLMVKAAQTSTSVIQLLAKSPRAHMDNAVIREMVTNWSGDGGINSIIIDVLADAKTGKTMRDALTREHTTVSEEIVREIKETYAAGEAKLNKAYTTTFPNQSKGYKDVMTAIEKWLDSVVQWIAKHKPAGLFADFYLEEDIRALGNQIIHAGERQRQEAYNRVVLKHKEAFKGMDDTKLAALHQAIIRNPNKNERDRYWNKLTPEQKAAFEAMETVVAELNAGLVSRGLVAADHAFVEYGQAIRLLHKDNVVDDSIDAVIKDAHSQIAGNPSFTKQNNSKMTLAQLETKYGMTPQTLNPMHMFMNYVSGVSAMIGFHDTIKEGMAKGFVRHTALAGMVVVDDKAFSLVNKHGGAKFKIMVGDKPFLINEKPAVFDTEEKATAAIEAYQAQIQDQHDEQFGEQPSLFDDESQKGTVSEMEEDDRSYMDIAHYTVTTERNFAAIGEPAAWEFVSKETFSSKEDAEAHAQKQSGSDTKIVVSPVFQKAQIESNTKLYFTPDFAKLINVILSKDDLRKGQFLGLSGEKVMKVKNGMTALEMSFSAFHAFTIGQEMMASNAAWHKGRTGDWSLKAFNPRQGKKDAFEISALMNKVITDNDYAKTTEGKAEMKRLLGSDSIDAVDIYHQFFGNGGLFHMDDSLKTGMENWGEMNYEGFGGFIDDMHATLEKQRLAHPNSPIAAFSKTLLHTTMRGSSAWLMEHGIPKIKFATFCREYSLKVDQETTKQGRPLTANEKSLLARNTMYFIEDRFGEVNWKNMWLNKSYKTALQFAFRSFTWVAGSWVALTKAGVDIAKLGWFTLKGEKYTLTERGYWGIAALAAHSMTAFSVYAVYAASAAAGGEEEEETDVATPLLTRLLFPRIDPYDNTKRIGIPSYVTESYKIFSHLGLTGNSFEPEKLITGRFNSLVGNTIDLVKGEDFRGVSIINPDDSLLEKSYSVAKHMMVSPISFSNIAKGIQTEGFQPKGLLLSTLGFSDAPAFAKRSHATNVAFELSRREYKGKEVTEEEMDIKDNLKKALYAYSRGDKSSVDELLAEGKVSQRQYDIAITRYPVINNMPNPKYKDPLAQALSRLTVKSALKVYEAMSEEEKEKHASEITKKMNNMRIRKDTPKELQEKYFSKWEELRA